MDVNVWAPAWRDEKSFPQLLGYVQSLPAVESGLCHYLSSPSAARCPSPAKAHSGKPHRGWLPDRACSLSHHGTLQRLDRWGWTAPCYQRKPKPFPVAGNNEMHKGMAGRKVAKRPSSWEKIKKCFALLEKPQVRPARLVSPHPQKVLYVHLKQKRSWESLKFLNSLRKAVHGYFLLICNWGGRQSKIPGGYWDCSVRSEAGWGGPRALFRGSCSHPGGNWLHTRKILNIVLPTLLSPTVQIPNKAIQTVPKHLMGDAIFGYIFYVVRTQPSAKQMSQEWQLIELCINQTLGTGIFKWIDGLTSPQK